MKIKQKILKRLLLCGILIPMFNSYVLGKTNDSEENTIQEDENLHMFI